MTTNKKLIISLVSICSILVIALVAVVAVFAATVGTVNSNVTVKYTATDIYSQVSANVIDTSGNRDAMTVGGAVGANTEVTFGADDTNTTAVTTLKPTYEIALETNARYVVFEFLFKNLSETYNMNVTTADGYPTMTGNTTKYFIYYFVDSATQLDTGYSTTISGDSDLLGVYNEDKSLIEPAITVAPGYTGYIYVMVKIANTADDSSLQLNFSWLVTQGTKVSS